MPSLTEVTKNWGSLVISRTADESIVIGDPADPIAIVVVFETRGKKSRLAVKADRSTPVHRSEVAEAILAQRATVTEEATDEGRENSPNKS